MFWAQEALYKNEATVWGVWPEVSKPPSYEQLKWHCRSKSLEKSLCGPDRPLANAPLSLSSPRCTHVYWFCYNRLRNKSLAALGVPLTTQTLRRRRPPTLRCLRALQAGRQVAALFFFRAGAGRLLGVERPWNFLLNVRTKTYATLSHTHSSIYCFLG